MTLRKLTQPTRKNKALARLQVSPSDLDKMPDLSGILREAVGSPAKAIATMRFSDDAVIQLFLHSYDSVPAEDRKHVPLEAIVLKSGVNPKELLGAIIFCFKSVQANKSALLAMAEHPKVLKKRIEFAKLPGNSRDRDALDTAVGFLPSPKGTSINFNVGQPPTPPKPPEELSEDADVNEMFPLITTEQDGWQEKRTKLLKGKD